MQSLTFKSVSLLAASAAFTGTLFAQTLYTPGGTVGNITGGNVGIGTSTPGQKLAIRRAAGASATADFALGDGTQWLQINSNLGPGGYNPMVQSGDLGIYYSTGTQNTGGIFIGQWSSSPRGLRIDPSGYVGIGIGLPTERLHVYSNIAGQSERIKVESQDRAGLELISDRADLTGEPGGAYVQLSQDGGSVRGLVATVQANNADGMGGTLTGSTGNSVVLANRWADPSGHLHFATQNIVRMTLAGSGNLGIGTTAPADKLQIGAAITLHDGGHKIIGFGYSPTTGQALMTGYPAGVRWNPTSGYMAFEVDGTSRTSGQGVVPTERMRITKDGNVGIGTINPTQKLSVNGTIRAKEVVIEATPWPDDVFAPGYALPTVDDVAAHIEAEGHLPGVPSAATVADEGIALGEMQKTLLRKVEELTLYVIELKRENAELRTRLDRVEHGE